MRPAKRAVHPILLFHRLPSSRLQRYVHQQQHQQHSLTTIPPSHLSLPPSSCCTHTGTSQWTEQFAAVRTGFSRGMLLALNGAQNQNSATGAGARYYVSSPSGSKMPSIMWSSRTAQGWMAVMMGDAILSMASFVYILLFVWCVSTSPTHHHHQHQHTHLHPPPSSPPPLLARPLWQVPHWFWRLSRRRPLRDYYEPTARSLLLFHMVMQRC